MTERIEEQRVEEIHSFRDLLTDEAKKVYDNKYQNTVIEIREQVDSSIEPIRHYLICQYFMVVIDPKELLNQFLEVEVFVKEGGIGTADWRKLPTWQEKKL